VIKAFSPKFVKLPKHSLQYFLPNVTFSRRYEYQIKNAHIGKIKLDPIYEGKCLDFINDGDLFWIVGFHEI